MPAVVWPCVALAQQCAQRRPVGTKKAQRLWLCFQPVLLSFPLERPIFLREYATVWMRTCEQR